MANKHHFFKKLMSSILSAACILSTTALGATLTSTTADAAATSGGDPSTFSWDNATVYFLLTDRFKNGDTSNDNAYGRQDINLSDKRATFHGGDFAGITEKINEGYFDDLGVNAIWLSAPYEQIHGYIQGGTNFYHYSYHGYYVLDYTETDAAFGTKEEFKTLVDTAHEHGIRIVMDIVMNHAGYCNMFDMNEFGYGSLASGWESFYQSPSANAQDYQSYMLYDEGADKWANWWGTDWLRAGVAGYDGDGGNEKTNCIAGLPDFKTESSTQVGIPPLLKNKWTKEGTLAEKTAKYGSSNTVTGYITTWLAEWVKEYGVDGFRCDTAKHVDLASWKQLKTACVAALKEWKANNPTKKMDDLDFWMTGEHWEHGLGKDDYYTQGGFDSMINFDMTGGGPLAIGSVGKKYSDYAGAINNDDTFNALTFISSHDETLARGDMYYLGSAFLMLPGAVQIYYGDETDRPLVSGVPFDGYGGSGHSLRSDMNWDSYDKEILKHWGIVGRFRRSHIAVGAGANVSLTTSDGVAFGRTYDKNGIKDTIAGVIGATAGASVTVDVSALWSDGNILENAYDGTTAVVNGGSVTFSAGAHGTILIQEPEGERGTVTVTHIDQDSGKVLKTQMISGLVGDAYTVSADAELTKTYDLVKTTGSTKGTYSATPATVTFYYHLDPSKFGTVTVTHIDAATGAAIADPVTLTGKIGASYTAEEASVKNYEIDLVASKNATGTFKSGNIDAVLKYNYVEPTNLQVHYYNSNSWSTVNMYTYDESGATVKQFNGVWPGVAMTAEGDGWFYGEAEDTESAQVIFNNGAGVQEPSGGTAASGYKATGEVWIKDGKIASGGKVKVVYAAADGTVLGTETLKGIADGTTKYTTSPKTFTGYTLSSTPANATGTFTESTITVTYTYTSDNPPVDKLVNNSSLSTTSVSLGSSLTAKCSATGGAGSYQYQVLYRRTGTTSWTTAQNYSSSTSATIKPAAAVDYDVLVRVKDGDGTVAEKTLNFTVKANELVNNSKLSSATLALGNTVTATAAATGGSGSYTYAFYYKKTSETKWTTVKAYSSTKSVSIKPAAATTYDVCIKVKDSTGTEAKKYLTLTVSKALTNTSKLSATSITLGKTVTVNASATGGSGYYNYAVYYRRANTSKWTEVQAYKSNDTITIKPAAAVTYDVCVKVKDTNGVEAKEYYTFKVSNDVLTNKSTVSATSITLGNTVTAKGAASGGSGSYQYAFYYKKNSDTKWTEKSGFSSTASVSIKPAHSTAYQICIKVKDSAGTIEKKYFDLTVTKALTNSSTISATSIAIGSTVTAKGAASGGTGSYQYAFYYKKTSDTKWTEKSGFSSTASVSIKPAHSTTYQICIKVKDSAGTIEKKYLDLKVTSSSALANNTTLSSESIVKGNTVTVKCAASGGSGSYTYAVYYKKLADTKWTEKQAFKSTSSVSVKPAHPTAYDICVKVKDSKGTIVKKYFTVAVNSAATSLKNTSKVSAASVSKNTKVTITGASSGATDQVLYKYQYKLESDVSYTTIKNYSTSTTATFTPTKAGTYTVRIIAQDMVPSIAVKTYTITVK